MRFTVEYTDTFGGEANYSWLRTKELRFDKEPTNLMLVRKAKLEMGLSGVRGKTNNLGDIIEFRPYGMNTVMFITYRQAEG